VELAAGQVNGESPLARELVGTGGGLREVAALLPRVAATDATVLLRGESGTGKELVARALHQASPRLDGPFVAVNCAALPPGLLESELFGFERGAFTGAHARRPGLVESAQGGTLFLDEIGDMSLDAQARLLRVLQERQVVRLGGREPVPVDVRVVAATHRDLATWSQEGRFRADLLYRLAVVPIDLPPLRARPGDVPGLVEHFLAKHAARHRAEAPRPTEALLAWARGQPWPGNVRELENWVERAVVLGRFEPAGSAPPVEAAPPMTGAPMPAVKTLRQAVAEAEREAVVAALRVAQGNKAEAARLLGVSYKTLFNKLHEHEIREERLIG
jgi:DNA-binding NtrC family response regulator